MPVSPGGSPSEPLTLVNPDGAWVGPGAPALGDAELKGMYRDLLAIQLLDQRFAVLVGTGKASITAAATGHEAAQVGIAYAIRRGVDWVFPYYRDQGLLLTLGVPAVELFGQMLATRADPTKGRQTPTHMGCKRLRVFSMSSPVGSHLPVAAGAAMALARREPGAAVVCSFGDGATSTGDFHGGLTMAAVQRAPIVFLCENNQYAISVGLEDQIGSETIAVKAVAYGMPGQLVDGLDLLAVRQAVSSAVERARQGDGPSLIELRLYRYAAHSSSDDDSRYRSPEEVERWRAKDPIVRYRRFLDARGLWSETWETALREDIRASLDQALRSAEAAGPVPPAWMFDDVYADLPWHLREQRDNLARELE